MSDNISIQHVLKKYGENVIIPDLNLEIKQGEFFTLLVSSGCGRATLLRMNTGFNSIEGGDFPSHDCPQECGIWTEEPEVVQGQD